MECWCIFSRRFMELLQLHYFCTVAQMENVSHGAAYHQIPQPANPSTNLFPQHCTNRTKQWSNPARYVPPASRRIFDCFCLLCASRQSSFFPFFKSSFFERCHCEPVRTLAWQSVPLNAVHFFRNTQKIATFWIRIATSLRSSQWQCGTEPRH